MDIIKLLKAIGMTLFLILLSLTIGAACGYIISLIASWIGILLHNEFSGYIIISLFGFIALVYNFYNDF